LKTYLRILRYVKPYWKQLIVSIISSLLFAVLSGATIYLTIPLLDTLFQEKAASPPKQEEVTEQSPVKKEQSDLTPDIVEETTANIEETFREFVFSGSAEDILLKICFLILLAFLGKNLFGYSQSYFLAYIQQGIIKDIRNAIYSHLHRLPLSYFKQEKTGNLISRITYDVNVIQTSISAVFMSMFREPLTVLVLLGIALSISWKLTLFALVILPFSLFIIVMIGMELRKQTTKIQKRMGSITSMLQESISGIKIVKAFGMEDYEKSKFFEHTRKYFKRMLKKVRVGNATGPITEFVSVIVGVLILYFGGQLVLVEGTIRASEFLGFLFAIFQMMPPIKKLSQVNNKIQESISAGERVFQVIDTEPNIKNIESPKKVDDFRNEIKFDNVTFHYEDSPELILRNINFTVKKGEVVAFVGSSGAGKTTLVDMLPRFFDPVEGKIDIDGINIKNIKIEDLRKLIGVVTQETVLFNDTVLQNIAYGLKEVDMDKVIEAAEFANAHKFIMDLPEGYNTIIGERGTKLSGGQRQRISIARALLKNPPIMIFDEATSALDNESEVLVQEALDRLMIERTTFVIAHRLSTIRNADRIIVLDKGEIVQDGKHEELLKQKNGLYRKLYELQFRKGETIDQPTA
jgi:subfamily B ATP-binding cassette protein MsbA